MKGYITAGLLYYTSGEYHFKANHSLTKILQFTLGEESHYFPNKNFQKKNERQQNLLPFLFELSTMLKLNFTNLCKYLLNTKKNVIKVCHNC